MLQNTSKTLGFKKNIVYKTPPGGEVNHIWLVAYTEGLLSLGSIPQELAALEANLSLKSRLYFERTRCTEIKPEATKLHPSVQWRDSLEM